MRSMTICYEIWFNLSVFSEYMQITLNFYKL